MDFLLGLVQSVITVGAIVAILLAVAALFPIVLGLGTAIDRRVNNE